MPTEAATAPHDLQEAAEQAADVLEPQTGPVLDPMREERRRLLVTWIAGSGRATVAGAARAGGLTHRTLGRHLRRADWPSPRWYFGCVACSRRCFGSSSRRFRSTLQLPEPASAPPPCAAT